MRRVGGYNLDVFNPQSERPYTDDGSVNLAHLLVGSEGTLAWSRSLTLNLAPLPKHRALGVVNFPTLYRAMECAAAIVTLGPTAVELVDRTMIDLARANPAFRPMIDAALIGAPDAILLVEFIGDDAAEPVTKLTQLVELMADLGCRAASCAMTDASAQKALWDVRKAGLNIMMSMKGDGKPVSFIEDCAVPLEHLADYIDAPDARCSRSTARAARGTRTRRSARCTCGRSSTCAATARPRCARSPKRRVRWCASTKARYSGEHGDGLVRSEWVAWQFGPRLDARVRGDQGAVRSGGPDEPRQDRAARRGWTTRRCSASRRLSRVPIDAGARLVGVERAERSGDRKDHRARHRRRPGGRLRQSRRDVQQQRPLPQVRRRHDVPELPRHARRAAPHPRPREHAAARPVRTARTGRAAVTRRFTTRSTCASAARAAGANAPPASTWRR